MMTHAQIFVLVRHKVGLLDLLVDILKNTN